MLTTGNTHTKLAISQQVGLCTNIKRRHLAECADMTQGKHFTELLASTELLTTSLERILKNGANGRGLKHPAGKPVTSNKLIVFVLRCQE
jgi:hypothetical protein